MEEFKRGFIDFMVGCNVLTFGDFVTKSGRKTPFFINTGNYRTGSQLKTLGGYYAMTAHNAFGQDVDIFFGPAYKGIPLSVACAMEYSEIYGVDAGYCSNRKEIKDHGDRGILLGSPINDGDRVVIVEDVTTAGTSIAETMPIIKGAAKADILGLVVSVDRQERGTGKLGALSQIAADYGMKTTSIVTMGDVVEYLYNRKIDGKVLIDDAMREKIDAYYREYGVI